MRPETRYAKKDEWYVGYQTFGIGPPDILFITNWMTNGASRSPRRGSVDSDR